MRKALVLIVAVAALGILSALFWPDQPKTKPVTSSTPNATSTSPTTTPAQATVSSASGHQDGSYKASQTNRYESLNLTVTIKDGKLTAVAATASPRDDQSQIYIDYALPTLKQQALDAQSASIDGVSGATMLSQTYQSSLQAALDQAKLN